MEAPKNIADLVGRPLAELTSYLEAADYRLRADAACVIGDMVRDMQEKTLPEDTVRLLEALLQDIEPKVRLEAAITLSLIKNMAAAPVLRELTERRKYRLDAIHALGHLGDRDSIPLFHEMLVRMLISWGDKLQAAAALCLLGDAAGQDYLAARLTSRRYLEQAAACHFIGESRHPRAFELLSPLAGDEKCRIRDTAIRSLGLLDDPRAEDLLCQLYPGLPLVLQGDVVSALENLQKVKELGETAKKIITTSGN